MYIEIKINNPKTLDKRAYVEFYYSNKRYREYNGKKLSLDINPNRVNTIKQREIAINKLQYEFQKAFENGWKPLGHILNITEQRPITLRMSLENILNEKLNSPLSKIYKRDLTNIYKKLINYIPQSILDTNTDELIELDMETFLNSFKSSGTYYMNKRKTINVFFSELTRKKHLRENPIKATKTMKKVARLHHIYKPDQLKQVLSFLKDNYPKLHLCCLLAYGCFLRPHQEVRLLRKSHFNETIDKIILSASENKSRRVRTTIIPNYIREHLKSKLELMDNPNTNLLSGNLTIYNESYLNTQWSRAKEKMIALGLIQNGHTIYSFRHTGAVNVYRKTKDLHILQQLLGHSNMVVTLNYLRGLGELTNDNLRDVMPEL